MSIDIAALTVGQDIGSRSITVTRTDLVKYAGASGDFNPIHWNEAFATGVGLPGVIAHGMFTMGAAVQLVTDWAGDPAAVVDFQTRFTKPVPGRRHDGDTGGRCRDRGQRGHRGARRRRRHRPRRPHGRLGRPEGPRQGPGRRQAGLAHGAAVNLAAVTKEVFVPPAEITHWRNAVVVAYAASGIAFSTWVSRLPAIRDGLDLTPGTIGLLLLCMTAGSFVSVSASGLIVLRLGSKRTIRIGSIMVGFGLALAGFGTSVLASPVAVAAGLAIIGLGTASWNTASNVEGAAVERAVRRHIMPRLHGSFSLGTVAGAGLGAWAAAAGIPVFLHLAAVGLLVAGSVTTAAAWFRADITPLEGGAALQGVRDRYLRGSFHRAHPDRPADGRGPGAAAGQQTPHRPGLA